jgi:hypothetical protein
MIEWVILGRDYADCDSVFNHIVGIVPKKRIRVYHGAPTQYILELRPSKGTDEPVEIRIMTKSYYENAFKYGFHGKTLSSKTFKKYIEQLQGGM